MGLKNVVRATVFATKRADLSQEEFSRRFASHGQLVSKVLLKHNAISYHQQHRLAKYEDDFKTTLGAEVSAFFDFLDADGLVTTVFPTIADLVGFFGDPAHEEYLNKDIAEFATLGTVRINIGDENTVIENGILVS
ncbi:hypothetical protein BGW36DRAFT_110018 [Talaromyces proteolyticus]|uniref:EthD domain-containing protein n=1 Tax=Talaromyces proteolyticus TaxID=1131652 RepID=A0AAD4PYX6_9EURO|nr:uncharacterized protein BGW36DRAFT_110018 [Talaromyces proteolyticus]KAH8702020.1 hypothetical protein BGW36DRAFT_110018 [Talaromyces proteolyticus]